MKKLMSVILTLALLLSSTALAELNQTAPALNYVETVTYWGDGVFKIELMRNVAWRTDYVLTAQDASNVAQSVSVLGGDANDVYVQVAGSMKDDSLYTFSLVSDSGVIEAVGVSTMGVKYHNYCEYCLTFGHADTECAARTAAGANYEIDRCDYCGELGHEDDNCPSRTKGVYYCDECGQTGHDDDYCPFDDNDSDDWDEWCDDCGQLGHDDDNCPSRKSSTVTNISTATDPTTGPTTGTSSGTSTKTGTRQEYCDECRQYGHDDDNCPNERCDECGKTGHDDDNCPNERCDECGKTGHDDDNCPYDRD